MDQPVEAIGDLTGGTAKRWIAEIEAFERKARSWWDRAEKIVRRYRDDRSDGDKSSKLNILWANVEVLKPTVYARTPKADVQRRWKDRDPVGRVASMILERAVEYHLDRDDRFSDAVRAARDDLLLVGMGTVWQRYEPTVETVTPPLTIGQQMGLQSQPEPYEAVTAEDVVDDYVYWRDFGWSAGARTWPEVHAVWRKAYMTRAELTQRFGDAGKTVPLDHEPEGASGDREGGDLLRKATIYEVWCKTEKKVYWCHKSVADCLDTRDDPLGLDGFFPCPRPLFATQTTGTLFPVPDYVQYQDQAGEIDDLTGRINHLLSALRMRGLYAGDLSEIRRLFADGNDLDLIPVDNWALYAEKGGLKNAVSWLPVKEIAETIAQLYQAREAAKVALYEVTGLSDILRGQGDASETATAQTLKAQWGSVRVRERQQEVARFARDIIRIKAEIIAEHFQPEIIAQIANVESLAPEEQQLVGPALEMLRSDTARGWRIDIESDSTVVPNEQAEKAARTEFLGALTGLLKELAPIIQGAPAMLPMAKEMILFGMRAFKSAAGLETAVEQAFQALEQQAAQPPAPPTPDPTEQMKMQAAGMKAQADVTKAQIDLQSTQVKAQTEMQAMMMPAVQPAGGVM